MSIKSPYSSTGTYNIAEQERQGRNANLGTTNSMISGASQALQQFYSPEGMSAYAKGQQTLRESDTNKSFNNSQAAQRLRARTAGFGYEQPAEQAGETNVQNARAAELSRIPAETQADAAKMAMQAVQEQNSLANTQLGVANAYDPLGYYQTGAEEDEAARNRRTQLWTTIIHEASNAASAAAAA
jgi:hypothetical protein